MSPNKKPNSVCVTPNNEGIEESTRIAVYLTLKKFCGQGDEKEYSFPSSLNKNEKNYIRQLVTGMGLKCKNEFKDQSRVLTIFKDAESTIMEQDAILDLSLESQKLFKEVLNQFPLTEREKQDITPLSERDKNPYVLFETRNYSRTVSKLKSSMPLVPPKPLSEEFKESRESLQIHSSKEPILSSIQSHQVTLLTGSPGIGKTTQVPQYILESAASSQSPVRIVCAQPRRFSVLSVSERVSSERGESLGTTVGYQIRLESMTSPKTTLYFCTYGILLRSLMGEVEPFLHSLSHIILDEVHERNLHCDFLLTVLREHLNKFPNIKLILISSSAQNNDFLMKYFSGIHHVHVPDSAGSSVQEFYLEDIFQKLKYYSTPPRRSKNGGASPNLEEISPELKQKVDESLCSAFTQPSREKFETAYRLILDSKLDINYQHSSTGATLLMIGAVHGYMDSLENLILNGADDSLRANKNNWTALEFAENLDQKEAKTLLASIKKEEALLDFESGTEDEGTEKKDLAATCQKDEVDLQLIQELISHIVSTSESGAILVFLPGIDEISRLWALLNTESSLSVFSLHSRIMECRDAVFKPVLPGKQKVILSTSIGEASFTTRDVGFVIDSGRESDASSWISRRSADERCSRAGHGGEAYRIYTRARFASLKEDRIPEMKRSPLVEISLQCKLLSPPGISIVDFLSKCPDPPSTGSTRAAVRSLRSLEALSPSNEDVTELGNHLLDLPIEPHLGKMLLYAVTLKCLDPVLTIVCCLSSPERFSCSSEQLSCRTYSDHMVRLRIFQGWQKALEEGHEEAFCAKHGLSSSGMNAIMGLRSQLLGHLRACGFVRPRGWGDIKSLNQYSDNWAVVKGALIAGYYPNLARYDKGPSRLKTAKEKKVSLHPACALTRAGSTTLSGGTAASMEALSTDWLVFDRLSHRSSVLLEVVTPVSPIAVLLFGGPSRLSSENVSEDDEEDSDDPESTCVVLKIDEWTAFTGPLVRLVLALRQKVSALFLRRLTHPKKGLSQGDDLLLKALSEVLSLEDSLLGLAQPSGVGQKPRALEASFRFPEAEEGVGDDSLGGSGGLLTPSSPGFLLRSFKFFIIKATCAQAIEISLHRGVWQFGNQTEKKLLKALKGGFNPVVVFSIHGSGHFQGFAKFVGNPSLEHIPELVSQSSGSGSGTQYLIRWIRFSPLPFSATRHLVNPYNNRQVQSSRDGQELEPGVGDALCRLWDEPSPRKPFFGNNGGPTSPSFKKNYVRY